MKQAKTWTAIILHICVHIGALTPLLWLVYAIPSGLLGGDPVKELIHFLGMGAIRLLLLSLLITPLAKSLNFGKLMRLRRPLGLWCFAWASMHFGAWLYLDLGLQWGLIGAEIIERTYILVGFVAWILLAALAITSVPVLLRKMGRNWKKLHSSVYVVLLLVLLHFFWSLKSGWIEPAIYCAIGLMLMWPRHKKLMPKKRSKRAVQNAPA